MKVNSDAKEAIISDEGDLATPPRGRPTLGRARRVRVTTTIEPAKLALLRKRARLFGKSLGELADDLVRDRLGFMPDSEATESAKP